MFSVARLSRKSAQHRRSFASLATSFRQAAQTNPDYDVLSLQKESLKWTFSELQRTVNATSDGLMDYRFTKGDSIAIMLNNHAESAVTALGAAYIGVETTLVNPNATFDQIDLILKAHKPTTVVLRDPHQANTLEQWEKLIPELEYTAYPHELKSSTYPSLRALTHIRRGRRRGMWTLKDMLAYDRIPSQVDLHSADIKDSDIAYKFVSSSLQNTNYSHQDVSKLAKEVGALLGLGFLDRLAVATPLYEPAGLVAGVWAPVLSGCCFVIPSVRLDAKEIVQSFATEYPTAALVDLATATELASGMDNADTAKQWTRSLQPIEKLKKLVVVLKENESASSELVQSLKKHFNADLVATLTMSNGSAVFADGKTTKEIKTPKESLLQ